MMWKQLRAQWATIRPEWRLCWEFRGTGQRQWGRLPSDDSLNVKMPLKGQISARVYHADTNEWEDLGVISTEVVVGS